MTTKYSWLTRRSYALFAIAGLALWLMPAANATESVANAIYEARVQAQTDGQHFGSWNAQTGAAHPAGAGRDITYRESIGTTTNFSSLRVYRADGTSVDYAPIGRGGAMNLDDHFSFDADSPQSVTSANGSGWRTGWQIDEEGLRIVQDVIVVGTTIDDSAIYHTVEIINLGSETVAVGWRNLHDWSLTGAGTGSRDNPTNALERDCGTPFLGPTRNEFSRSPVDASLVRVALPPAQAADYSPVLSLGYDPGFLPALPVTVPDEYSYVFWNRAIGTAFDDTIQGLTNLSDSAGLSWFGRDRARAREIAPGTSVRFTQALFAFEQEECPIEPVCADVPHGLVGWWPLDDQNTGSGGHFDDVARNHLGTARFAPASVQGKVGRAASFDGANDTIAVQDADDLDVPAGTDLSIDFWIRTTDTSGVSIVLEKRGVTPLIGYQVFLSNGQVGLQLADGNGAQGYTNFLAPTFLADGDWHLVAVTVSRGNPQGGAWYVDGEEVGRFDPTGHPGSLANDAQLLIGGRDPDAPAPADLFRGELDEIEIARRVFSAEEIAAIYQAGSLGKCSVSVDAPWDQALCANEESVFPQITVCNNGGRDARFTFDFAGLPPDPPGVPHASLCDAPGSNRFTLLGNAPLVVPAGECRTARVRIDDLPADASCYQVQATDLVTGATQIDYGFIPITNTVCCIPTDPVTPVRPGSQGSTVRFDLVDTGLGQSALDVRIEPFQGDELAPPAVRIADAEPGAAVDRTVSFGADGTASVEVPVALTEDATPLAVYDLVLSAELDGDPERELLASASVLASADACVEGLNGLCLNQDRFRVEARWRTAAGEGGVSQAVPLTSDTGFFWFFTDNNLELVVKVLDACGFNDRFWVFAGGLTDVEVDLVVTDLLTGDSRSYSSPLGEAFEPVQDTDAFATCDAADAATWIGESPGLGAALAERIEGWTKVAELPLNDNRFVVEVEWETLAGETGVGEGVALTADTGYFSFFDESNVEMTLKVLDACGLNDRYWVFAAGLTDTGVRLTITDTVTGEVKVYTNPLGAPFQPIQDTNAFATCP